MPRPQNSQRSNGNTDTNDSSNKNGKTVQLQGSLMTTDDLREHLEGLRGISTVASRLFALLGEQITSVSYTIPIQRGYEAVKDLGARAKLHQDGLETSFDSLREQLEQTKQDFWLKHGEKLEAELHKYVEQKIKDRVKAEVNNQLKNYVAYLNSHEANKKKLNELSELSHARLQNSLLRISYPAEPITWIGNPPEEIGLGITFGQLIGADETSVLNLARSLGLSPAQDDDHLVTLNRVMQYLGIAYQGIPSHTGVLLVPTKINP